MEIRHGRVSLWLEPVRDRVADPDGDVVAGRGAPLLVLHALGSSGAEAVRALSAGLPAWPGPVFALDFCGHGRSGRVRGGAYSPELMAADADVALAQLGAGAWVCGAGLGAYVALLLAGARPDAVAGAILWPGAGLEGGGSEPDFGAPERPREGRHPAPRGDADPEVQATPSTDPRVMHGLAADIRPLDYVESFALDARRLVLVEGPGRVPPWWERVRTVAGVTLVAGDQATPAAVLALAAGAPGEPGSLR